ncbi:DUF4148 domain-containing protein [Sphaerotilus sp.]|uniref:DUF4148 domain-containing protein n=1 Tax=Sphaerotilus sp. TaxID=2093942 RepID=UPI002ACE192C|nr:DUF4148 domain-containing protein [Sphaerotilus sp.]MDZ7857066.1 DUF4148 domain-containing protein [Sphaerotilus sp.]
MNTRTFSALLVASTLSFGALADDVVPTFQHEAVGASKTRAEVITDMQQARLAGKSFFWDDSNLPVAPTAATPRTRAEVLAELREAQASGEFAALHADEPTQMAIKRVIKKDAAAMAGQVKAQNAN